VAWRSNRITVSSEPSVTKKEEKLRRQQERASLPRDDSSAGTVKEENLPET